MISIPFKLAPRVIERMKEANPNLTLIGCKLLSGSSHKELITAASHVCHKSRCNAVVANDMKGLKTKHVVMPDLSVQTFEYTFDHAFEKFYAYLDAILDDIHFSTCFYGPHTLFDPPTKENRDHREALYEARRRFDRIVGENREGFTFGGGGKVFGSLAVRILGNLWLVSPRKKDSLFTSEDAVIVFGGSDLEWKTVKMVDDIGWGKTKVVDVFAVPWRPEEQRKATLNAPLLIRTGNTYKAAAVLHQHQQLEGALTEPYAPPGTVRDNLRSIPGPVFNIEGHGFIKCYNEKEIR